MSTFVPMQFLAQINLRELPPSVVRSELPQQGLLYFFADGNNGDPGRPASFVHWHASGKRLRRIASPDPQAADPYLAPIPHAITSKPVVTLPSHDADKLDVDLHAYEELRERLDGWQKEQSAGPKHQPLGHPWGLQGMLSGKRLLLQLASDDRAHYAPLSDGRCFFTLGEAALRNEQFQKSVCEQHRW